MDRKKRYKFGQNYLKDPLIINSILSAIHPIGSKVLEIGPGNGALTSGLAKKHKLTCLEIDPENVEYLSKSLASESVEIIQADFLSWTPKDDDVFEIIAGNLPYNISSQILLKILKPSFQPQFAFFMLQKEVAERIIAKPGSRNWGKLGVKCSLHYQSTILFDVPPESFDIKPKVMSAFIEMQKKISLIKPKLETEFFQFIDAAFQYKRKTLINNLKNSFSQNDLKDLINPKQRPEELSTKDYVELFNQLKK